MSLEKRIEDLEKSILYLDNQYYTLKNRIDGVYERLVALANAESTVQVESDKWIKYVKELREIRDDVHSALEKTATEIMVGKFFRAGDGHATL